jgi:flagellar biosynthesis protein FliQ
VIDLVDLARRALILAVTLSLPVVLAAALAGLVSSVVQATTHAADPSVAQLPRLVVVTVTLLVAAPWMGAQILDFAGEVFRGG